MEFGLKLIDDEMVVRTSESEFKTKTAIGISRFLTQKIIRMKKNHQTNEARGPCGEFQHTEDK
jgi:hypothetical protein